MIYISPNMPLGEKSKKKKNKKKSKKKSLRVEVEIDNGIIYLIKNLFT